MGVCHGSDPVIEAGKICKVWSEIGTKAALFFKVRLSLKFVIFYETVAFGYCEEARSSARMGSTQALPIEYGFDALERSDRFCTQLKVNCSGSHTLTW